ncbi:MAG TPA: hypothetical protein VGS19_19600 [Streptosporangiaceae bacterium]|nr:hypothetical protein [Streptosporangiaceae bacterium]
MERAAGPAPSPDAPPSQDTPPAPGGRAATGVKPAWWHRAVLPHLRHALSSHAGQQAAILLGFLAAGVALTWPRATYLTGSLPESRDSAAYVWGFWWVAHQVTHLGNPWFTPHMAAPVGVDLGFHTLMPLPGLLLTPVTLVFGPSASYNLLVTLIPGLLCYACYRVARLWLSTTTGAVAAGAFFGLSAMLTQQDWYHVNIAAGALFLPLALEASVRLRRAPGPRQGVTLGLVMGAAVLTDQESAVLAAIVTALALVPWLVWHPGWPKVRAATVAVATGSVLAIPQIIAMVQEIGVGGLAIPASTLAVSYKQYGIGLPGMFTPTPRVADFGLGVLASPFLHSRDNEGMPMFGTLLTVLAVAGIVALWRRRSTRLLAAMWLGCAVLALGASLWVGRVQYLPLASVWNGVRVSDLMPYTWFVRIPGLSSFREADRLAILGLLPAALLAGAAVDWLARRKQLRYKLPLIAAVAVLALLELGYSGTPKVGKMPTSYAGVDRLISADRSSSAVVDIPFGLRGGIPVWGVPYFPQALVMATEDNHPRGIAYTARVPNNTVNALRRHPFYSDLIFLQHQTVPTCPWNLTGCVYNPHQPSAAIARGYLDLTAGEIAAARQDAARMHIGWAVVWKRNPSDQAFVLNYLHDTGFRFAYLYDIGHDNVLVYRHVQG